MDLNVRSQSFVSEDQSWLGSRHGTNAADPITLDGVLMATVADADGVVKSGICIAKVTASAPGFLFTVAQLRDPMKGDASTVTNNVAAALLWHGEVVQAKLPIQGAGDGFVDNAAKALMPLIRFV
jgi:hypothetical protein